MTVKGPRPEIEVIKEQIAHLQGIVQGIDLRIETLESRLAVLEQRVTQPVGGQKR